MPSYPATGGVTLRLGAQGPERTCQAEACRQCFRFFQGGAPPVRRHFVVVPSLRQLPGLVNGKRRASGLGPLSAPEVDVLLGTEEQHRLSGKNDVLPPTFCRDREMDDPALGNGTPPTDFNRHPLAAIRARCLEPPVPLEHRDDAQTIPDARPEVALVLIACQERRGHRAKADSP